MRIEAQGATLLLGLAVLSAVNCRAAEHARSIDPRSLPSAGQVDRRFQSYNIEMVEVTGGRFWKPYNSASAQEPTSSNQPGGMDASLFEYRAPINLSNSRLRKLAAALGPAYVRVSGTWANTTWFADSDGPAPASPPPGYKSTLTHAEWKGVIDFANAVGAQIVTSFPVSDGTRDASGSWTPKDAARWLAFTRSAGGNIAAAEFMNEPTFPQIGGAPKGYNAIAFAHDVAVFRAFMKKTSPATLVLGPGGVGEGSTLVPSSMATLKSEDILAATGPVFDGFSYHSYGAVSSRCSRPGAPGGISADAALGSDWLEKSVKIEQYYAALRDRYEPGKPLWLTETAEAACGGDRWAATFLDTFRYLNQLASLARQDVQVHMHNTLAASDYGLLDEKTYEPRPDYWAALLWHRFMGSKVLDAGHPSPDLYVYAHCLPGHAGGVTVLAINPDRTTARSVTAPIAAERYTLSAASLSDAHVKLNGAELELGADDSLPVLKSLSTPAGSVDLPPASITFLTFANAENAACRNPD